MIHKKRELRAPLTCSIAQIASRNVWFPPSKLTPDNWTHFQSVAVCVCFLIVLIYFSEVYLTCLTHTCTHSPWLLLFHARAFLCCQGLMSLLLMFFLAFVRKTLTAFHFKAARFSLVAFFSIFVLLCLLPAASQSRGHTFIRIYAPFFPLALKGIHNWRAALVLAMTIASVYVCIDNSVMSYCMLNCTMMGWRGGLWVIDADRLKRKLRIITSLASDQLWLFGLSLVDMHSFL